MANLFDPTGRTAIVTGACGLIGRQHCAALAAAGANVVVADLVLYTFVQRFLLKIIVFDYIILPLDRHFAFSKLHLVTG